MYKDWINWTGVKIGYWKSDIAGEILTIVLMHASRGRQTCIFNPAIIIFFEQHNMLFIAVRGAGRYRISRWKSREWSTYSEGSNSRSGGSFSPFRARSRINLRGTRWSKNIAKIYQSSRHPPVAFRGRCFRFFARVSPNRESYLGAREGGATSISQDNDMWPKQY